MRVAMSVLLGLVLAGACWGGSFDVQLLTRSGEKTKQVKTRLVIADDGVRIETRKGAELMGFQFDEIKRISYERSTHPRWKTAVFLSPLALLSKSKHHWLNIQGTGGQSAILRLGKHDYQLIRNELEAKWGHEITVLTPE